MQSKLHLATPLLTVEEAAAALRLKPNTLRQKILRRAIEYQKIGGAVRIRAEVIERIIHDSTVPALEGRPQSDAESQLQEKPLAKAHAHKRAEVTR